MSTITVISPSPVREPRGSRWAARAAFALLSTARAWSRALSGRWQSHSESARRLGEAASVRRLAASWQDVDPRFAADLFAAADRHERSVGR